MKRCLLIAWVCLLAMVNALAQEYQTGKVKFNGLEYPAYVKEVDASEEQSINAIKEIFDKRGINGKEFKNFYIYRNVELPATGNRDLHDLFVKVEPIGNKKNNRSKIFLIITKPGAIQEDKPDKGTKGAPVGVVLAAGGAAIFSELTPAVENQVYLRSLLDQEDVLRKAENKLKDLMEDSAKLEKQILKLQTDKEANKAALEMQNKELEAARAEMLRRKSTKPKS